jgi:hypothetical protein
MFRQPSGNSEPLNDDQFDATAWRLQQRVNAWFRENESWRRAGTNLIELTDRGPEDKSPEMTAHPDGEWYQANGQRPESRPRVQNLRNASFWCAVEPLYDLLHSRYRLAWTYSVLMLQANENFRGTFSNLGVGDHFSARSEVIFTDGERSEIRAGWHVNQLPPFLVEQGLTFDPPFELISSYALNVRFLTDALPFTFTRIKEEDASGPKDRRVISVAPFYELFKNDVSDLARLVESAGIHYNPEKGWGHGGVKNLEPIFAELGHRLKAKLPSANSQKILDNNYLFKILCEGSDPEVMDDLRKRLSRPDGTHLALAQYLVLMSAVWPDWQRITMIPHPVPILSHPQPGGIVICEDTRSKRLTTDDIRQIADLVSIAVWPWVSLQGGARLAEEAMRNAALLGEVVRHDLSNSLSPVRVLLLRKDSRLDATDSKCAEYLSRLNILNCTLEGLCGLEDSPYLPKREEFEKMFSKLIKAFSGNPKAAIKIESQGELQTKVPRLYYAVYAELILNAVKRRPASWPEDLPSIVITAQQDGRELIITVANTASDEKISQALAVFDKSALALSERARMNVGGVLFRKGVGLVVSLVKHARGNIYWDATLDASGRRWLNLSIRIL